MPASRLLFQALVGLVSIGSVAHTAIRSAPAHADEAASSSESAVFARHSELNSEATTARLRELTRSEETHERLQSLNKALASGTSAREIEASVLALVEKSTSADADTTLAAILLDYYKTYLKAGLNAGDKTPADVFKELGAHNDMLTTATYGRDWRSKKSRVSRHRRR